MSRCAAICTGVRTISEPPSSWIDVNEIASKPDEMVWNSPVERTLDTSPFSSVFSVVSLI